jgi:UDP-2,3-diacylglucosamine hydrolase
MLHETLPRHVLGGVPDENGRAHAARPFLFLSDLHLSPAIPRTVAAFEHFVRFTAAQANSVFILGDLFEYWIGDATLDEDPFAVRIAALLRSFSARGIALYVMHGNRDFLLGPRFMKEAGATLLKDPAVIMAFGQRIVLAHGDAQCTADPGYQWFRRFARSRTAQALFLRSPFAWRRALAQHMRAKSEAGRSRPHSDAPRYDVTREGIAELFQLGQARIMIHGHTHKPARHTEPEGVRWVLPDWDLDHGKPRGGYLEIDADGARAKPLDG